MLGNATRCLLGEHPRKALWRAAVEPAARLHSHSLPSSMLMRKQVLLAVVLLGAAASCAARTLLQADPSVYPGASPADQATQEEARLTALTLLMCCTNKWLCWLATGFGLLRVVAYALASRHKRGLAHRC